MKIVFLARSLGIGGAERQMILLANGLKAKGHDISIVTFYDHNAEDYQDVTVPVISLKKGGRWDFTFFNRLVKTIKELSPDIVHGYLTVPNIFSGFLKLRFSRLNIVWGVRASNMQLENYDFLAKLCYRLECVLSRFADLIIVNSSAGYDYAISNGFKASHMQCIYNGIDTERFIPNPLARKEFRSRLGFSEDIILIGVLGRLDPMKGHSIFFNAASTLVKDFPNIRFLCVGDESLYRQSLKAQICDLGISSLVVWISVSEEVEKIYSALDILCSSSIYGEGFSNVIAEAMACGVPCVVTDVGDSKKIVDALGVVVAPNDSISLSSGLSEMIQKIQTMNSDDVRQKNRSRVTNLFSRQKLVADTESVLELLINKE